MLINWSANWIYVKSFTVFDLEFFEKKILEFKLVLKKKFVLDFQNF